MSRLTTKGRIAIPAAIRKVLNVEPGDLIACELQGNSVKLIKIGNADVAYHQAIAETLDEWLSPEDAEAFRDL